MYRPRSFQRPGAALRSVLGGIAASALAAITVSTLVTTPAGAAIVPRITLEEMAAGAEVIVQGRVDRAEPAWSDDGRIIVTRVEVAVERAIKGGPRARVAFEVPGGRIGDQILVASGAPVFRQGDRVVLFLVPIDAPARVGASGVAGAPGRLAIAGWNQGAIQVHRDAATGRDIVRPQVAGTVALDREGKPVKETGAAAGPWPLDRFLDEVVKLLGDRPAGQGPGRTAP